MIMATWNHSAGFFESRLTYFMLEQEHAREFLILDFGSPHISLNNAGMIRTQHCEQIINAGLSWLSEHGSPCAESEHDTSARASRRASATMYGAAGSDMVVKTVLF